jgi:hypothetical protein
VTVLEQARRRTRIVRQNHADGKGRVRRDVHSNPCRPERSRRTDRGDETQATDRAGYQPPHRSTTVARLVTTSHRSTRLWHLVRGITLDLRAGHPVRRAVRLPTGLRAITATTRGARGTHIGCTRRSTLAFGPEATTSGESATKPVLSGSRPHRRRASSIAETGVSSSTSRSGGYKPPLSEYFFISEAARQHRGITGTAPCGRSREGIRATRTVS